MKYLIAGLLFLFALASLWVGSWAMSVYASSWQGFPISVMAIFCIFGGVVGGLFVLSEM